MYTLVTRSTTRLTALPWHIILLHPPSIPSIPSSVPIVPCAEKTKLLVRQPLSVEKCLTSWTGSGPCHVGYICQQEGKGTYNTRPDGRTDTTGAAYAVDPCAGLFLRGNRLLGHQVPLMVWQE